MLPGLPYNTRQSPTSVRRDAWVEVSLTALEHNLKLVKSWLQKDTDSASTSQNSDNVQKVKVTKDKAAKVMAVVKSDAYGHGAPSVAELFEAAGADYLGVASIDEGTQLRASGIKAPVLILSPTPSWALDTALDNKLDISVSSLKELSDVDSRAQKQNCQARVHLKVDTGMHRLGISPSDVSSALDQIESAKALKLVSVFSHLACASDLSAVQMQDRIFKDVVALASKDAQIFFHLASSEAARAFDFTHYDMVRIGLYLYGLEPNTISLDLQPALSVRARINHIGTVPTGQSAGYGWTWTASRESRLAMIPIGYADGVDRGLSNRMQAIFTGTGQIVEQVGRISMDQMLFDITDVPGAQEGDVLTLIGDKGDRPVAGQSQTSIYLSQWAQSLDTITYELACRLRARLPRVYTRSRGK
ncbi:MAG: Alanine racemase [Cyanobacteriota bacterium erpe_2018_sw_39hr_WHONDRS-SW48-000098_B_bin.30]|jgi:alanine racemase|nr:Alanine racemase [Cyanobacteriota bacterium erpe_2018_sw_39hr_WHONDRS-SW48-000098_B_bin.30]